MQFVERLEAVEKRYDELSQRLSQSEVFNDRDLYKELSKEHSELGPLVTCFREWRQVDEELKDNRELAESSKEVELIEMAREEIDLLEKRQEDLEQQLLILLAPKDPNDDKNIILEIRAGTGGEEAALFASNLFSMYCRYAESRRWKVEMMSHSDSSVGGLKEVIARIAGKGAYSRLKYERGVHRVQRVPETETQGRVHTSTVTVAVLPEAEEVEVSINESELRIDVYRSSGPGGQSVNTTDSAVRITHIPTGLVVTCQDEKSQHKNKAKALTVLRSRLLAIEEEEKASERAEDRRSQIGTGERSERIRTYNFPQGRVSDHRISLTLYKIDQILQGELDMLVDPLATYYQTEVMKGGE